MKYYEINEEAARRAKEMNSFSDYKTGSATAEYRTIPSARTSSLPWNPRNLQRNRQKPWLLPRARLPTFTACGRKGKAHSWRKSCPP